ncbi:LysR family transcriptional regulator [Gordonia sp. VNQ95]|uniref:LysR family transcriptional regulator n=1 Tax=Gordonia sp. VNQ95 TaxID=3156619 RepID=UPI0032B31546
MELRQLEYFLACCDTGTFTAAAKSLHVVQSAVSSSVAKLEKEVGARLFDRTTTALVLTEAGQAIVEPARAALRARSEIVEAIGALRGDISGHVSVGALINIATIDLAEAFGEVHRRHPGITIAMRQNQQGSAGNVRGIRDGTLDLALLGGLPDQVPGVVAHRLAAEPLVLVGSPDHPLMQAGSFSVADLADERTIDFPPGWGTRAITDRHVPNRRSVIEVADQDFGIQLALNGFGLSLVPVSVVAGHPRARPAHCRDADLTWVISIAHSATRTPSTVARAVLDIVREVTTDPPIENGSQHV